MVSYALQDRSLIFDGKRRTDPERALTRRTPRSRKRCTLTPAQAEVVVAVAVMLVVAVIVAETVTVA